jgi:hypothetical protein
MSLTEVIEHDHLMAGVKQFFGADAANVSRAASDKNFHGLSCNRPYALRQAIYRAKPLWRREERRATATDASLVL